MIGKDIIEYVQSPKCLGVTIDNHLNWNLHISGVLKSYKAKVSQLRRMSYLPVKEEIYFMTIISSVTFGMAVWGMCSPELMIELEKTHIPTAKLIYNLPRNVSYENVLATVSWNPLVGLHLQTKINLCAQIISSWRRQAGQVICDQEHT